MSIIDWGVFLAVLIQIESSGNSHARGDDGRSIGILQIGELCIEDVNRIYNLEGTDHEYYRWDAYDVKKSKEICKKYLSYWGYRYEQEAKAMGQSTFETYARIWNGGPKGYKKEATDKYWERFQSKAKEMGYKL